MKIKTRGQKKKKDHDRETFNDVVIMHTSMEKFNLLNKTFSLDESWRRKDEQMRKPTKNFKLREKQIGHEILKQILCLARRAFARGILLLFPWLMYFIAK